jgi:hypothetical protein
MSEFIIACLVCLGLAIASLGAAALVHVLWVIGEDVWESLRKWHL